MNKNLNCKIDEEIITFCQNIKILRERNGLSKKKMAEILGIGVKSLSNLEQGIMPPKMGTNIIFKISQHFKIKPCELFCSSVTLHPDSRLKLM